jgi:hypothetical protein
MPTGLRRFTPAELLLPPPAAWEALRFFFPADVVGIYPEDLTLEDRLFAQALLVAALDETRSLGPAPGPEETPLVAAGWVRLRPVVARLVGRGRAEWFASPVPEGTDPARIDEPARASVSIRYRAGWIAHVHGGPLL